MSCNECRDNLTQKNITRLAFSVILICWAVWMLIDDVEKIKRKTWDYNDRIDYAHKRISYLADRLDLEDEKKAEEVESDG